MTIQKILTFNFLDEKISVDYDFKRKTISIYSLDDFNNRDYTPLERIFDKNFNQDNIEKMIIHYLKFFDYISNDYKTLDNEIETTYKREIFKRVK